PTTRAADVHRERRFACRTDHLGGSCTRPVPDDAPDRDAAPAHRRAVLRQVPQHSRRPRDATHLRAASRAVLLRCVRGARGGPGTPPLPAPATGSGAALAATAVPVPPASRASRRAAPPRRAREGRLRGPL